MDGKLEDGTGLKVLGGALFRVLGYCQPGEFFCESASVLEDCSGWQALESPEQGVTWWQLTVLFLSTFALSELANEEPEDCSDIDAEGSEHEVLERSCGTEDLTEGAELVLLLPSSWDEGTLDAAASDVAWLLKLAFSLKANLTRLAFPVFCWFLG